MTRPSSPECIAETARLAYHLHWELGTLIGLEHRDRLRLVDEVARLNERALQGVEDGER